MKVENELLKKIEEIGINPYPNDFRPKDKAKFDIEGKDSYKFYQTGAEVVVTSPTRTTYFSHRKKDLDEIIKMAVCFNKEFF